MVLPPRDDPQDGSAVPRLRLPSRPFSPNPEALATSESTRARRFALPDLEDERTGESIEAFLEGPDVRRSRPLARVTDVALIDPDAPSAMRVPARARPSPELRTLPGRLDWYAALARESVRAARYGRPAAVLIVELIPDRPGQDIDPWLRTLAGPIARALRQDSRETDLVARVSGARFQMLLPETDRDGAARLADRVAGQCRAFIQGTGAQVAVRVSVAGTSPDDTLHDALAHALRSIEAA